MTHKIGMMTSSNQPPAGHTKYYFLKINIKDYYDTKFQVYVIFSPPLPPPGSMTPTPSFPQDARLNKVNTLAINV